MAQERPQIPADMKQFNRQLIEEFRANRGKLSGPRANMQILLLTTTGRRSGEPRTVVIGYRQSGDAMVVIASNNGAPGDPAWYRNLLADPHATVEVADQRLHVQARITEGDERERMAKVVDYLDRQQALTKRQIPVLVLEPQR
jgi:deazaflavin-dependent oxidoreductase (nitroreductase family)